MKPERFSYTKLESYDEVTGEWFTVYDHYASGDEALQAATDKNLKRFRILNVEHYEYDL